MAVKGSYLAVVGVGGILLWSGLSGKSWSDVIRQIIKGKRPSDAITTAMIASNVSGGTGLPPSGATGPTLTPGQIGAFWIANGGNPLKVRVAVCIASHESGGRVRVTSPNPDGGTNVGLYQLDTRGKGAGYSVTQLQDPGLNTRVTIRASSNGNDWSAWATASMCGVLWLSRDRI